MVSKNKHPCGKKPREDDFVKNKCMLSLLQFQEKGLGIFKRETKDGNFKAPSEEMAGVNAGCLKADAKLHCCLKKLNNTRNL